MTTTESSKKKSLKSSQPTGSSSLPKPRKESSLERKFKLIWQSVNGPSLEEEYKFHPVRKWRSDFAHIESKVMIEIEGAVWTGGRHTRGAGYIKDCEKYNEAAFNGWAVISLTGSDINQENLLRIKDLIIARKPLTNLV